MATTPTVRSLALQLKLSVATVSEALRDSPNVKAQTKARVLRAANKAGYRANPLLGAALSAVRRARHLDYRGTLALIDTDETARDQFILFHREIIAGASARAEQLGFTTEVFWLGGGSPALEPARLANILHARGITGAVLLPFNTARDLSDFDFSRIAAVQMDHCLIQPHLHTVLPDHYISMMNALERLTTRGYERVGLAMELRKDARMKRKWSSGFLAFFRNYEQQTGIPALIEPEFGRERFIRWFRQHRPDLIVGHRQEMIDWLLDEGVRVPEHVGFFNLNVTERTGPCAGLDLLPRRLGAAAVETVVAMLHRQERGVPEWPHTITLEAQWVDGPTIRKA
jgi:LacI family transcriptional regulator